MAPNKKKKKPAANPARGFATVSVASKVKAPDPLDETDAGTAAEAVRGDASVNKLPDPYPEAATAGQNSGNATKIEDMTPEELEAHFEDSELQSLLDTHSTAGKSDAARQVSRLLAERRQLRAQAYKLNSHSWLEDDTIDKVLHASATSPPTLNTSTSNAVSTNDSKRLVDLWILQRVLSALRLGRVSDVIKQIVLLAVEGHVATETGLVWGLAEAFDWYARHSSADELPDYDVLPKETAVSDEDSLPQEIGKRG